MCVNFSERALSGGGVKSPVFKAFQVIFWVISENAFFAKNCASAVIHVFHLRAICALIGLKSFFLYPKN